MVEGIIRPSEQTIENSRLVLKEVPLAMQADINPLAELTKALHIQADQYGKPFTGEALAQLRKTRDVLIKRLKEQYPGQPVVNISDALVVLSLI